MHLRTCVNSWLKNVLARQDLEDSNQERPYIISNIQEEAKTEVQALRMASYQPSSKGQCCKIVARIFPRQRQVKSHLSDL
jgi:hypothetical protein